MKFRHKRRIARFRSDYRQLVAFLRHDTPEANVYKALIVAVAIYYLCLIISARPAEIATDQAGALLLNQ